MARGKQICKILKEIRRQIAEANDIELATSECRFKGECLGTCPKCEAEVRYLEQQLRARSIAGRAATIAGISVGTLAMMLPSAAQASEAAGNNDKPKTPIISIVDDFVGEVSDDSKATVKPNIKISFDDENGGLLNPTSMVIERVIMQDDKVIDSKPVTTALYSYYYLIIYWDRLPTFTGEKKDDLKRITLRITHPEYRDVKIVNINRPESVVNTTLNFTHPKK